MRLVGTDVPSTVRTPKQAEKLGKAALKDRDAKSVTVRYRDKDGSPHTVTVAGK